MSLEEYEKVSITNFKGLYQRGLGDECPPDHSPVCQNMRFNRNGEVMTRDGSVSSVTGISGSVRRMFVANFSHDNRGILLTCDGSGHIHRADTGATLLTVANMIDFVAINMYSYCLIAPILSTPATPNPVYIWQGVHGGADVIPIRPAAGVGPGNTTSMTAMEDSAFTGGHCDLGDHLVAVSFITNTGYTTQPGPLNSPTPGIPENPSFVPVPFTVTNGTYGIAITGIPTGPTGTVARQILLTQSDQTLFFYGGGQIYDFGSGTYIPWNGVIEDNTTTFIVIAFYDTDLAVSADSLFDLLPVIPAGTFSLIAGIFAYNGRALYWGGEFNLIRVTNPGSTETIDNVAGYIQLPDQFDGNDVTSALELQGTLSLFKATGIFSTVDNGGDPNTWQIITTDTGAGCSGAVSLSIPTTQDQVGLLTDFGGVYLFNGSVVQPPLTWKINDLWTTLWQTTNLAGTMITIDPYNKLIYIAQTGNAIGTAGYQAVIVGDYNDGLDAQNIKWSVYTFPFTINSILMAFFQDASDTQFRLRIGSSTAVYKLEPDTTTDNGSLIGSLWQSYYLAPPNSMGALNIFRFLRARLVFLDNIEFVVYSQDNAYNLAPPGFTLPYVAGRDLTREFNFMGEKCSVQITSFATQGGFLLQRLDIYCRARFNMRPSV